MLLAAEGSFQLENNDEDKKSIDYPNFPKFVQTFMTVFRFSVGS
jgi:hypothetical protein